MIHELRIYHCTPGRLADLSRRFETRTLNIWKRLGIRPVGFWTSRVGPNNQTLYYMLEWKDWNEREHLWHVLNGDAEWKQVKAETEKDGPLIAYVENIMLSPTSYSPLQAIAS
ncbi:MAG: NIPSNAP family protein [Burkholderiales bacterium]|nr:NIPSNAP family protein [Burkholderiales bacterium]